MQANSRARSGRQTGRSLVHWLVRGALVVALSQTLMPAAWAKDAPAAPVLQRFDTPAPVWSMAPLRDGYVLGEVTGRVAVVSKDGVERRSYDVGGLPLALVAGRFSPEGPEVIVVAAEDASGSVYCLANAPEGLRLLWKFPVNNPVFSVALGDVDGDGKAEVAAGSSAGVILVLDSTGKLKWKVSVADDSSVGAVAIGDINGDGRGEVVAGTSDDGAYALSGSGKVLWHLGLDLPGVTFKQEQFHWVCSAHVCDINGDGKAEVILGSRPCGMVSVLSGDGQVLWRKKFPEVVNRWSTAMVEPADLNGDGKQELACLLHGIVLKGAKGTSPLLILDSQGNLLSESYPEVNLVCVGSAPTASGRSALLLGSPTRGHGFYSVSYPAAIAPISLTRPKDSLDALAAAVAAMSPRPATAAANEHPVRILVPLHFRQVQKSALPLRRFLNTLEGPGLRFEFMLSGVFQEQGKGFRPPESAKEEGRAASRETILATARYLEQQRLPFYVQVAKVCRNLMPVSTCEAVMEAAPTQCLGFLGNENAPTRIATFEDYVVFADRLMDACHRHGDKKYVMDEFRNFWSTVPADPRYYGALFKPAYRNVLVPMYKTNQYCAPEQQLGMIVGLWKAGVVGEWGCCTEEDLWKWGAIFMNPPHDVIFRMDVTAALLGATYYRIEENRELIGAKRNTYWIEEGARRHRDLFHSLVRKGVIAPAQRPEEVVVSPVVLKKAEVGLERERGLQHGNYWQHAYEMKGLWAFPWALQAVRDSYPFSYLYQMRLGCDGLFPQTPYGYVTILPAHLSAVSGWTLTQDTARGPDGKPVPAEKIREALLKAFEAGSAELPATAEGCLCVARRREGGYRIFLLDSGQLDVSSREVGLRLAHPETVASVIDVISGEKLPISQGKVQLRIPAGTLRVLDLRLKGAAPLPAPGASRGGKVS